MKFGQYADDNTNYAASENRTVYYDNVTVLKGNPSGAYNTVKP